MSQIEQLAHLIRGSKSTVFFGGAGVSTESGIPDFRSESGLYAAKQVYGHPPERLLSHSFFIQNPEIFFRYYKEILVSRMAKPNAAHTVLAELERQGMLRAVVTQNVDGLHQAAGSKNVLELHGSSMRHYCMNCGARYTLEYVMDAANCKDEVIPVCEKCGGIVRPDVVLYEEGLDGDVINSSVGAIGSADLMIVGGTSLVVYPAAGLLRYFKGGALVLINKSETQADGDAGLVIREPIGAVMSEALKLLG